MAQTSWHKPEVNRDRVWEAYVAQFGQGHAFGLLQENGQNSFDAYPDGTLTKNMKVVIKYDADRRNLSWRDFNTNGMPHCRDCVWGERADGTPCTHSDCPWGAFHNMGYSVKSGGDALGSRGMGKSLQLLAGKETLVRTSLPDGRFAASEWVKSDDWEWRLADRHAKKLSASGTELETSNVVDAVHEVLVDDDAVVVELQERWFRLIEEKATIEYLLLEKGHTTRRLVGSPKWPELDKSQGEAKAQLELAKVVITYQGERLGELRNFYIFLAKEPFPDEDPRWGIAIVKNGKQTVTRFTEFPSEIPDSIRRRIYGWCDAVCTTDDPFLKTAENSTHTGYRADSVTYKAVKRQLREIAKKFAAPFIRTGGERVSDKEAAEAKELLEVLNEALKDIPEFQLFLPEGPPPPPAPQEPREYVYLSRIDMERRSYNRRELVPVKGVVKNPTPQEVLVRVVFEHFDPTPVVVASHEEALIMPPGTIEEPSTSEAEWRCPLDKSQAPGLHWMQVSLRKPDKQPCVDVKGDPVVSRHSLYVEEEPPEIKRKREGKKENGGTSGFENLHFFKKPDLAETYEAYIDMSQAKAFVNLKGKRLANFRENAKNKRGYWPVVGELVGEKIVEQLLDRKLGEKDDWKAEDVKKVVMSLESNRAKLVRVMVDKLNQLGTGKEEKTRPALG